MTDGLLTVACVCTGTKFSDEYVYRLWNGVQRNLKQPFRFHLITDFTREWTDVPPTATTQIRKPIRSFWDKLVLFKPGVFERGSRVLFIDLDVLVCGELDSVVARQEPFLILRDGVRPYRFNSSVMLWTASAETEKYYTSWIAAGQPLKRRLEHSKGDQAWIEAIMRNTNNLPTLWQDVLPGVVVPYYTATPGEDADDTDTWTKLESPVGASLVVFHGRPRLDESTLPWVKENWR